MKKKHLSKQMCPRNGKSKFFKFMKILSVLLTVCAFAHASGMLGQRVDISVHDGQILDVIQQIEKQCDYRFAYSPKFVDMDKSVSYKIEQAEVKDVLNSVLSETNLTYVIDGDVVVLRPKSMIETKIQQSDKSVKGIITDETGEPLPGVTVFIKGSSTGTITDIDGNYSILNVKPTDVLVFSFIGMQTQEVLVGDKTYVEIALAPSDISLDEVVAVGYGTVKKSDLTGAVSSVKGEELTAYPALNATDALQGRSAGVMVQSVNGAPGSSVNVRIRGFGSIGSSSNPLYVIDGFPGGTLPPAEDIESIEILKDASATAIYGSRGANGVVMVTTKRGKIGKPKIELKTSFSLDKEINKIDLLNKDQFVDYISGVNSAFSYDQDATGTDWQDEIFRTGLKQDHKLSFSGGSDEIKYYVSTSMYDQKGVITNSRYKRYSLTSNIDIQALEKINMGVNIYAQRSNNDGIRTQEYSGGADNAGVISSALTFEPTASIYDSDGSYTRSTVGDPTDNPVAIAKERITETVEDRLQANLYGEYQIIKDLKFRATIGANIRNQRWGYYVPTTLRLGEDVDGDAGMGAVRSTQLINENYLTYTKKIGENNITIMAGNSYESYSKEVFAAYASGFITDSYSWWNLSGASTYNQPSSSVTKTELQSYYGRLNYKLYDKYLLTLNGRYDGSSVLADGHKWTFFPSGAFAWNVMEEPFMKSIDKISQLKLRLSYGISGNQSIAAYQSLATFQDVQSVQNSTLVNAVRPISVANDNLTWEKINQTDIGINLGLFNQRVSLTADYFRKETTDLLFEMPLPEYSGYSTMYQNIGSVENKGVEFAISTVNFDRNFKWVTDFNISTYKNKVLELPDGDDIFPSVAPGHMTGLSEVNIIREGEPVGLFYGYVYDGVIQDDNDIIDGNFDQYVGGEKYKDIAGSDSGEADGTIDSNDRTVIGNPHPDFIWGLNNTFSYKGFDMNIFIQGSQGNDIYSFTLQELETMNGNSNSTTEALNCWSSSNTDTDVPIASSSRGYHSSSRWVFDGSYVRLKTVALGYNLPNKIIKAAGFEKVRFSVSAQNILTISGYRGFDPEVNYRGSNSSQRLGFDYGSYPNCKSITFGLDVIF